MYYSFHFHKNPMKSLLSLLPSYRWRQLLWWPCVLLDRCHSTSHRWLPVLPHAPQTVPQQAPLSDYYLEEDFPQWHTLSFEHSLRKRKQKSIWVAGLCPRSPASSHTTRLLCSAWLWLGPCASLPPASPLGGPSIHRSCLCMSKPQLQQNFPPCPGLLGPEKAPVMPQSPWTFWQCLAFHQMLSSAHIRIEVGWL